ncbi:transposase family protein [Anthocerotibacter panamensis]|uniref:transposase family protein n=1 Tax=Anthocerotibacter panamensis TaxID=2857077 RepID=UPI001C408158
MLCSSTQLLDLPDVLVVRASELLPNQLCLYLELLKTEATCPQCQTLTQEVNQVRSVLIRDLSAFGQQIYLHVPRR